MANGAGQADFGGKYDDGDLYTITSLDLSWESGKLEKDIEFNYIKVMKIRSPQTFRMDMHKAAEHTTKHLVDLGVTEAIIGLRRLVYTTILADKLFKSQIMPIYLDEVTVSSARIR